MHLAFGIAFFLLVGLSETVRRGVFGLTSSEITGISISLLLAVSLLFLRSDVIYIFRSEGAKQSVRLPEDRVLPWTWKKSVLGLFLSPLLLLPPLFWGIALIQINLRSFESLIFNGELLALTLVSAVAYELFFRETVIRAFRGSMTAIVLASSLSYFTFWMPAGLETALLATGSGLFYLALRMIGVNILIVAVIHASYAYLWTHVLSMGQLAAPELDFAVFYAGCAALLAFVLHYLFTETEPGYRHA